MLNYPTFSDFHKMGQAELLRQKTTIDPTIFGSFASAFITAGSALAYTNTLTIRDLEKQAFPQSSEGEFLELWGGYEGLTRNAESAAEGAISIPGDAGISVPTGTRFTAADSLEYRTTAVSDIETVSISVSSITRVGTLATVTTSSDNTFATGLVVTVAGAIQSEYNGDFVVAVISRDQFTYDVTGSPTTPATGTITAASPYASATVICQTTGAATNQASGATLNLNDVENNVDGLPTVGIDTPAYAQFDGLTGGAAEESDDLYRTRILLSRSIIEGVFTAPQIRLAALSITGNTRAFVVMPELSVCDPAAGTPGFIPTPGQVAVYILRDGDDNIIPSQTVLDNTKAAILIDGALPGNSSELDVFVLAPLLIATDFTFTELVPDTATMRTAVEDQLEAFFQDSVDFETNVTRERYLGSIDNTVDLQTGDRIASFAVSVPAGDIVVAAGEIADLGVITFP